MTPSIRFSFCAGLALAAPIPCAAVPVYSDAVVSFAQGSGTTHPNFQNSADALGAPDYSDPTLSGFGTGAVALGVGGTISLHMSAAFTIGGDAASDLLIYEIGPSQGGTAESATVSISEDGSTWFDVGTATGGTSGIDIDGFGFTASNLFQYVRLTDLTGNAGAPAGADIDAVAAINAVAGAVPEPSQAALTGIGLVSLLLVTGINRQRRKPHAYKN